MKNLESNKKKTTKKDQILKIMKMKEKNKKEEQKHKKMWFHKTNYGNNLKNNLQLGIELKIH
jgi:hypothetical protein